jgi:hypothetical protein
MDWTDFFQGIATAGTNIASAVIGPRVPQPLPGSPGAYYLPPAAGGQIVNTGGVFGTGGGLLSTGGGSSVLIILLIALVFVFVLRK